jgi:hypothetical protein
MSADTTTWMLVLDVEQYFLDVTSEEVIGIRGFVDYFNARFSSEASPEFGEEKVMRFSPIARLQLSGANALELLRHLDRSKATAFESLEVMQKALDLASERS